MQLLADMLRLNVQAKKQEDCKRLLHLPRFPQTSWLENRCHCLLTCVHGKQTNFLFLLLLQGSKLMFFAFFTRWITPSNESRISAPHDSNLIIRRLWDQPRTQRHRLSRPRNKEYAPLPRKGSVRPETCPGLGQLDQTKDRLDKRRGHTHISRVAATPICV